MARFETLDCEDRQHFHGGKENIQRRAPNERQLSRRDAASPKWKEAICVVPYPPTALIEEFRGDQDMT
jgi:hypothetical protein